MDQDWHVEVLHRDASAGHHDLENLDAKRWLADEADGDELQEDLRDVQDAFLDVVDEVEEEEADDEALAERMAQD